MIVGQEKPPLDEILLAHSGVKGMHWGVRKKTPQQQIKKLTKKIDKIDANKLIEGVSLRGWAAKKQYNRLVKQNPKFSYGKLSPAEKLAYDKKAANRVKRSVVLRGAAEAGVIVGGTAGLIKVTKTSPQGARGALVAGVLLAGQVGYMRLQQVHAVNASLKLEKLQRERLQLGYNPK